METDGNVSVTYRISGGKHYYVTLYDIGFKKFRGAVDEKDIYRGALSQKGLKGLHYVIFTYSVHDLNVICFFHYPTLIIYSGINSQILHILY